MSQNEKSVLTLIGVGLISMTSAVLSKHLQESISHKKIAECAKLANSSQDQWIHDWHSSFGKCIEVEFQDTVQPIHQQAFKNTQK